MGFELPTVDKLLRSPAIVRSTKKLFNKRVTKRRCSYDSIGVNLAAMARRDGRGSTIPITQAKKSPFDDTVEAEPSPCRVDSVFSVLSDYSL
jgi:hypothetical protein